MIKGVVWGVRGEDIEESTMLAIRYLDKWTDELVRVKIIDKYLKGVQMNQIKTQRQSGFTLIELLVVIAIIGLLSSIVLASLSSARAKSRDARRISDLRQIKNAVELYYDAVGSYPHCLTTSDPVSTGETCGPTYLEGSIYMLKVPRDPSTGQIYSYTSYVQFGGTCTNAGHKYHLGISLELSNNPALKNDADLTYVGRCVVNIPFGFYGNSASAGGQRCDSNTAGTPQPGGTETCYDITH